VHQCLSLFTLPASQLKLILEFLRAAKNLAELLAREFADLFLCKLSECVQKEFGIHRSPPSNYVVLAKQGFPLVARAFSETGGRGSVTVANIRKTRGADKLGDRHATDTKTVKALLRNRYGLY
jgi:hypothetical protein